MFPPGHALFGYLLFSLARRGRGEAPTDASIPWLLFGTQLPDLIDKPLAWGLHVLPVGRSLAHSILFAIPAVALVGLYLRRRGQPVASEGFGVGYFSHLLGDVIPAFTDGIGRISFLVWPLLPPPGNSTPPSLGMPAFTLESMLGLLVALVAAGLVTLLWIADGRPGLGYLR